MVCEDFSTVCRYVQIFKQFVVRQTKCINKTGKKGVFVSTVKIPSIGLEKPQPTVQTLIRHCWLGRLYSLPFCLHILSTLLVFFLFSFRTTIVISCPNF